MDSEIPVDNKYINSPWQHLAQPACGGWKKPETADNASCHLMVVCMESWFMADKNALKTYFAKDFNEKPLPSSPNVEAVPKEKLLSSLEQATKNSSKGKYDKGEHSFNILALINPEKVKTASSWANRFLEQLKK